MPAFFKNGGESLAQCLNNLLRSIWHNERVLNDWSESTVTWMPTNVNGDLVVNFDSVPPSDCFEGMKPRRV